MYVPLETTTLYFENNGVTFCDLNVPLLYVIGRFFYNNTKKIIGIG